MKQINLVQAYKTTDEISKSDNLSINAKWVLYKLRKELASHYEFYVNESKDLFNKYETSFDGDMILFKSIEEGKDYKIKQAEIDNFEVEFSAEKQKVKLSDIPNITVQQMEELDDFIEFTPE